MKIVPDRGHQLKKFDQPLCKRTFCQRLGWSALALTAGSTLRATSGLAADVLLDEGMAEGDGIELFYVRAGEGKLIIFLHGHPENWFLYQPYLLEFGKDHLAVAPNLRGYNPTGQPKATEDYEMRHYLEDLHRLIDHFGRESCLLVANDWGAQFAWVFASAYPDRVEWLVIMNSGHPALILRDYKNSPTQIAASQYERAAHIEPLPYSAMIEAIPPWVPATIEEADSMSVANLADAYFLNVARTPATTSLKVSVPTLVIWGMLDTSQLPGLLDGLEDYVSDLSIMRIEDAGHYPMQSHRDDVIAAMRAFISKS